MKATVAVPICPLTDGPRPGGTRVDEVLLGMTADVLEEAGARVCLRTHYGYEGWAERAHLVPDGEGGWAARPKVTVSRGVCDVLAEADIRSEVLLSPVRGSLLSPVGRADGEGWQEVALPGGRRGYLKHGFLGRHYAAPPDLGETALRGRLVRAAQSYLGTPYRWGGKSPMGMDCSGLVSMAYLLNGILIWRDAALHPDYPVRPIPLREAGPGDLLYFPGHVAMYLGAGAYLHATARDGSDGVVRNSLDPKAPDYRADLAEQIGGVGSIF